MNLNPYSQLYITHKSLFLTVIPEIETIRLKNYHFSEKKSLK